MSGQAEVLEINGKYSLRKMIVDDRPTQDNFADSPEIDCHGYVLLGKISQAQLEAFYNNYPDPKVEPGKVHIRRDWRLPLEKLPGLDKLRSD